MAKYLKITQTQRARKRAKMGSDSNSAECFDAISETATSVLVLKEDLQIEKKKMKMFESHIPFCHAAYFFGKPSNCSELEYRIAYKAKIMQMDKR